jgi:two-component system NtrC family sensor kinase
MDLHQHVLLVDDEEQILECTKMLLENNQFKVTTASSGEEANRKLHEQQFDLIISDLRMPGSIDGKTLFHIVQKEMPQLARKMLFITGDTLDQETYSFLTNISNRHVKKPFTVNELLNALAATIGLSAVSTT